MSDLQDFGFGTQIRKSPYFDATVKWGAQGFSVYNHMYIPRDFGSPEENFWNLINHAILCDVAVERQVQIIGPDAAAFVQYLTPRDLSKLAVGQCKYILITNQEGGIINDPVLLRLEEQKFWISLADSDVLLWAQGVAVNAGFDVEICEPDVSPVQLQGPQSLAIMQKLFGYDIADLKYYWLRFVNFNGMDLVISRTGWSSERGYEIYLQDNCRGTELWDAIMEAGQEFGLKPGHTSTIRRIEGGMLSYHADMDIKTNPFELGLDRLVNLDVEHDFIGKKALKTIKDNGVQRKQIGLIIEGAPLEGPNTRFWPLTGENDKTQIGHVTSAVYSPRLKQNIALAMVESEHAVIGNKLMADTSTGARFSTICEYPFYDPKKAITKS